jgi:hypothetical protein
MSVLVMIDTHSLISIPISFMTSYYRLKTIDENITYCTTVTAGTYVSVLVSLRPSEERERIREEQRMKAIF